MNPEIEKLLCDRATAAGAELRFAPGQPIRVYDSQDDASPIALIDADQPRSELIYVILHAIGHNYLHFRKHYKLPIPWFLNRPYENEMLGDAVYKSRRALKLFCGKEWQTDLWALTAYYEIGCLHDLEDFLTRHPKMAGFMWFIKPAVWKTRLIQGLQRILHTVSPMQ